jgi:hypothetical protein
LWYYYSVQIAAIFFFFIRSLWNYKFTQKKFKKRIKIIKIKIREKEKEKKKRVSHTFSSNSRISNSLSFSSHFVGMHKVGILFCAPSSWIDYR